MITVCNTCKKNIAPGMQWVHLEDHEKGRIMTKPFIRRSRAMWICFIGRGKIGQGSTPTAAYNAWRIALDY